jgi:hypothetical protein
MRGSIVKNLAFAFALLILALGVVGIVAPSVIAWIAQHALTAGVFYVVAVVRVAFGLLLVSVASASRAPRTLRVLGCVIVVAGIAAGLMGLLAMDRASAMVGWWLQQGSDVLRLTCVVLVAVGGFIAYACAPGYAARASSGR